MFPCWRRRNSISVCLYLRGRRILRLIPCSIRDTCWAMGAPKSIPIKSKCRSSVCFFCAKCSIIVATMKFLPSLVKLHSSSSAFCQRVKRASYISIAFSPFVFEILCPRARVHEVLFLRNRRWFWIEGFSPVVARRRLTNERIRR